MNSNEPSSTQELEPVNETPAPTVEFVRLGRGGIEVSMGTFSSGKDIKEDAVFMRLARTDPAIEGRLLAGFLFLGPDHARKVFDAVVGVETAGDKMVKATKEFMLTHNISCPESVYQNDRAVIDASSLVETMCEAVGYPKSEEEEVED